MTQSRNDSPAPAPEVGEIDPLTGEADHAASDGAGDDDPVRSLLDDIEALIEDGRVYLDAEFTYQKTRAAFVSDRVKKALVFGVVAAVLAFVALIGLIVGLIIALTPHVTGWGATAIVVGLLLLIVFLLLRKAAGNWSGAMSVMREKPGDHAPENE